MCLADPDHLGHLPAPKLTAHDGLTSWADGLHVRVTAPFGKTVTLYLVSQYLIARSFQLCLKHGGTVEG